MTISRISTKQNSENLIIKANEKKKGEEERWYPNRGSSVYKKMEL